MSPKLSFILTPTDDWSVHDLTISSMESQVLTKGVEFILVCSSRERLDRLELLTLAYLLASPLGPS